MARSLLLAGLTLTLVLGTVRAGAEPPGAVVVVVVDGAPLDAARLRNAIARELALTVVGPDDPRAATAAGRLRVEARPNERTLTVTYARAGTDPKAGNRRTVPLGDRAEDAESRAVHLAGNLARDEASEILGTLAAKRPPSRASLPEAAAPAAASPALPPVGAPQVAALTAFGESVAAYERGATEYRGTLTEIVRLHYEAKKQATLAALDREIAAERGELDRARRQAVRRLEEFLAAYASRGPGRGPGPAGVVEAVPDAMFRLAALHEEIARAEGGSRGLAEAVRLYQRILGEYPGYREEPAVRYFLGHALADSGRASEAQAVWRSLVCANRHPYPLPPEPPREDATAKAYVDVYPASCRPAAGPSAKYLPETWWQIGNAEFDQADFGAGAVWGFHRAASAYRHALEGRSPVYGVSLYKYAWTLFKQQRYAAATAAFVDLLRYTDEEERRTGDRGADFRSEAVTYIAGSLATLDFVGPAASAPHAPRPDALETIQDPALAERKLHVAVERLADPAIIPQDRPWTVAIYRALALELRSLGQRRNAIEVYEAMLARWPLDASAPETTLAIAESYDEANMSQRPGSAEYERDAGRALAARADLRRYVGRTPWVDANKDDPDALRKAERLSESALRTAAAAYTNRGRALVRAAAGAPTGEGEVLLARASEEYRRAAAGWAAATASANAIETDEAAYWNADARHQAVRLDAELHRRGPNRHLEPAAAAIADAIAAARNARDAASREEHRDNAALWVVDLADVARDLAYLRGQRRAPDGIEERRELEFDGTDPATRRVVARPIPDAVRRSMAARDEHVERFPRSPRSVAYREWVAETAFLYGDWEAARPRLEALWKEHCGTDGVATRAWERLMAMATLHRDEARALALAAAVDPARGGKSCDAAREQAITRPVESAVAAVAARRRLEEVCGATFDAAGELRCPEPAGERRAEWREVGALHERLFETSGDADAILNAAFAYRKAGDLDRAAGLYERALARSAPALEVHDARMAYDALAAIHHARLDPASAAAVYGRGARANAFAEPERRALLGNAMALEALLDRRDDLLGSRRLLDALHPSAEERERADYRIAMLDVARSTSRSPGSGANVRPPDQAEASLASYWDRYHARPALPGALVEVASALARMKRARGAPEARLWLERTVAAWDTLAGKDRAEADKAPWVDQAAEAAFALLDDGIAVDEAARARRPYPGRAPEILGDPSTRAKGRFQEDAAIAERWDGRLEREVVRKFASRTWVPVAIARQGSLFDSLRVRLYETTKVNALGARGEALVAALRAGGQGARADDVEDAARDWWLASKQRELDAVSEVMVRRYATAVAYPRASGVESASITRAAGRLAYYTELLGDAKLAAWVGRAPDPTRPGTSLVYREGMYVKGRGGLALTPAPPALPGAPAAPVVP